VKSRTIQKERLSYAPLPALVTLYLNAICDSKTEIHVQFKRMHTGFKKIKIQLKQNVLFVICYLYIEIRVYFWTDMCTRMYKNSVLPAG
jgi:hypothetical protein